jgi:DNA-binding NtrC family response regulator
MISGESTFQEVIKATRMGAVNFIPKSDVNRDKVRQILLTEVERLKRKTSEAELLAFMELQGFIGKSKAMMAVGEKIVRYGKTELSVLVTGETGTGKKVVAKALHAASRRNASNFVTVDIPNIPQSLFQSELFGHTKGSFSGATMDKIGLFQQAHLGTLFLDEIGDLPLELQPGLFLPIENKKVRRLGSSLDEDAHVRIIAATDRNLPEAVSKRGFREQLYHRLRECEIMIPPLRERREDIPLIADYYLQRHNEQRNEQKIISSTAIEYLQGLSWQGNIRQLTSVLKCVFQTVEQDMVGIEDIMNNDPGLRQESLGNIFAMGHSEVQYSEVQYSDAQNNAAIPQATIQKILKEDMPVQPHHHSTSRIREAEMTWRKETIKTSLSRTRGNVSRSAAELGVSRQCLHAWIGQYGIEHRQFRTG